MTYETLGDIIADIGKPNVTPKHLIQAAFELGAGEEPVEFIYTTTATEEVEEIEEEVEEEEDPDLLNKDGQPIE